MTERVRAAAGIVAAVVAGVALLVWGAVVVTMLARDQPVPWSEVTLAVTTIAGALGALFVRPPARRPAQKAGEVDAGELARILHARRKSGSGLARADAAGIAVMIAALLAAAVLVWTSSGCGGALRPDAPAQTRSWTSLACSAVDAVCAAEVLPPDAQRWCATSRMACRLGAAVAVAVVDAATPSPVPGGACKTAAAYCLAHTSDEWRAACATDAPELAPACEAVLSGDAAGTVLVPVP